MAIYLKGSKVGFNRVTISSGSSEPSGGGEGTSGITISDSDYSDLQKAVSYRTGNPVTNLNITQMINNLKAEYMVAMEPDMLKDSFNTTWTRPNDWPDLDSLNLPMSGDDYIYMTYDASQGRCAICLYVTGTSISVTVGHITNGTYVVDETLSPSSDIYTKWYETSSGYPVVRVTGTIQYCEARSSTNNGITQAYRYQPIVERIAWVPNLIKLVPAQASQAWGTYTLQRDKVGNGTGTALTDASYAWAYCRNLQSLDISNLYIPNVTTLTCTFQDCIKLKSLDLKHWNVSKNTSLSSTFNNCRSLTALDLTGWTTTALTTLGNAFNNCRSLKSISGISDFNTSKVTTLQNTFLNCYALTELDLSNWDITNKLTSLYGTFSGCYSLEKIDVSSWNVDNVTTCYNTFTQCRSLKMLDLSQWNLTKLTTISAMFSNCFSLQKLDISGLHIDNKCTSIYYAFGYCISLKELVFPTWTLTGISNSSNTANSLFTNCWSLESITGISNWNFSSLNNSLASMFQNCYSLKTLDISSWNVSTVTSLATMFSNCQCLSTLNLSSWAVSSKCTTMASMFQNCYSLKSIGNISSWDTQNCTTFASMFACCFSLQECPSISSWNVAKVTTTASMFSECYSFKTITIQNWTLTKCTTIATMFRYCYGLETVNLSGWTFPALTVKPGAFLADCYNLRYINGISIPAWDIEFTNCNALSVDALNTIIAALPQTGTARTLKIMTDNLNRLSTDEKAVATGKNWTVAN